MASTAVAEKAKVPAAPVSSFNFADRIFEPLVRMRSEFDRMFDDFGQRPIVNGLAARFQTLAAPALELKDKDGEYVLTAEVPGMKAEQIEVKISNGILRLSGERKEEHEETKEGVLFSERHYGRFERSLQLPPGIDQSKITAKANDGVLSICLPKTAEAIQREVKIPVQSA